jgi:hypothetical protein
MNVHLLNGRDQIQSQHRQTMSDMSYNTFCKKFFVFQLHKVRNTVPFAIECEPIYIRILRLCIRFSNIRLERNRNHTMINMNYYKIYFKSYSITNVTYF